MVGMSIQRTAFLQFILSGANGRDKVNFPISIFLLIKNDLVGISIHNLLKNCACPKRTPAIIAPI